MDTVLSSALDLERMLRLPPPPPWAMVKSQAPLSGQPELGLVYMNGVTGEVTTEHPLRELWTVHFETLAKQKQQQQQGLPSSLIQTWSCSEIVVAMVRWINPRPTLTLSG